ncbi:MAG: RNase adapter RapZ [Thermoleophilia bacterium]
MELTVITGMSGAGKSKAMGAFEDAGWFCVDNLPPGLLPAFADLVLLEGSSVERAAVASDVRGGVWFRDLEPVLERIEKATGVRPRVVFLEASDETLLNRFRETRRPHPLSMGGSVADGIARERRELSDVRERADLVIDTTGLSIWDLRRQVTEELMTPDGRPAMHVQFASFGYKHGVPRDADLLFDVRFLQNPHYEPSLKGLTGLDPAVVDFVTADPGFDEFRSRLESLLDYLLPAYEQEGKAGLVVGIGCTGGRHRSVAIAEMLARRYSPDHEVSASHRHIDRPSVSPDATAA